MDEETRAAWASLMQQRTLGEYDGGSQSRKNPKHLMGNTSPIRYGTIEKTRDDEYTDFIRTKLCYEILNLPEEK